jgi:hypothetical protein
MDHFRTKKQGNVSFRESKIMNILKLGWTGLGNMEIQW